VKTILIEAAFFKLPEVLMSQFDHADTYEATLQGSFVAALMMEFNPRSIRPAGASRSRLLSWRRCRR
jgi:hypothetical protein